MCRMEVQKAMQRDVLARILEWNGRENRKPLILMGARQVGKTWLMDAFAKEVYPNDTVYVKERKKKHISLSPAISTICSHTDSYLVIPECSFQTYPS